MTFSLLRSIAIPNKGSPRHVLINLKLEYASTIDEKISPLIRDELGVTGKRERDELRKK